MYKLKKINLNNVTFIFSSIIISIKLISYFKWIEFSPDFSLVTNGLVADLLLLKLYLVLKNVDFSDKIFLKNRLLKSFLGAKYFEVIKQEFSILNSLFFDYKKDVGKYSYSNKANITIYAVFVFLLIIETFIVELILNQYDVNSYLRISILVASIYGTMLFVANLKASILKKHIITDTHLILKSGILNTVKIPFTEISKIEKIVYTKDLPDTLNYGFLGKIENFNAVVKLNTTKEITILYGIKKKFSSVNFQVDDFDGFSRSLTQLKKIVLTKD